MNMEEFFNLMIPSMALIIIHYGVGVLENRFEKSNINDPNSIQSMLKVSRFI